MERSPFLQEVEERGQLKALRVAVRDVLEVRLGQQPLPNDIAEVVQLQTDLTILRRWLREGMKLDTPEQVRSLLGLSG